LDEGDYRNQLLVQLMFKYIPVEENMEITKSMITNTAFSRAWWYRANSRQNLKLWLSNRQIENLEYYLNDSKETYFVKTFQNGNGFGTPYITVIDRSEILLKVGDKKMTLNRNHKDNLIKRNKELFIMRKSKFHTNYINFKKRPIATRNTTSQRG